MKKLEWTAVALALAVSAAWVMPVTAAEQWKIKSISVEPAPRLVNESNQKAYGDGTKLTVKCSYYVFQADPYDKHTSVHLIISDNGSVKVSSSVTYDGTRAVSYNVSGLGLHTIKCAAAVLYPTSPQAKTTDEKVVYIAVTAPKPTEGTWPSAPKRAPAPKP
jgi:hypothetical protein